MSEEHKKKIGIANAIKMKQYWKDGRATEEQLNLGKQLKERLALKKKKYGYINSPETREKLRRTTIEAIKRGDIPKSKEISPFVKGHRINVGRKLTKEWKRKIGEANSKALKGKESPKKGKTYEEINGKEKAKEIKERLSKSLIGRKVWNKGKKGIMKAWNKGKTFEEIFGKEKANEIKKKISQKNSGRRNKWGHHSQETIKKIKQARARQVIPKKDTSIEVKIQSFLTQLHLEFYTHQYMHINHGYQCDIFIPKQETEGVIIPKKTVIECDGCYWHSCKICKRYEDKPLTPKQVKQQGKDNDRTKELEEKGYNVIRLWEHEIKPMKLNEFKEKVK